MSVLSDVREHGFDGLTDEDWSHFDRVADRRDDEFGDQLRTIVDAHERGEL